jgi:aspartyl/glutamyl-tRNA(Asn/Gln) amidotransferase C subunit
MSLTLEQVQRIAHLARIEISESEALTTQGHLNGIFQLIEQMQAVDTLQASSRWPTLRISASVCATMP